MNQGAYMILVHDKMSRRIKFNMIKYFQFLKVLVYDVSYPKFIQFRLYLFVNNRNSQRI